MADVEGEPAEQRLPRLRVVVEALKELGCLVGGLDDDPLVGVPPSGWPLMTLLASR